jgi:hypothetical protein
MELWEAAPNAIGPMRHYSRRAAMEHYFKSDVQRRLFVAGRVSTTDFGQVALEPPRHGGDGGT